MLHKQLSRGEICVENFIHPGMGRVRVIISCQKTTSILALLAGGSLQHCEVELFQNQVFQPAFGCAQHPKAGQNTQQMCNMPKIAKLKPWGISHFVEKC